MFGNIHEESTALIFQFVSLKLLKVSRIDCFVVRRILENLAGGDDFSNFAGLLLWIYVKILFNILINFGWIYFQTALVGCFYEERIINKQELNYICCTYNKILRRSFFILARSICMKNIVPAMPKYFLEQAGYRLAAQNEKRPGLI